MISCPKAEKQGKQGTSKQDQSVFHQYGPGDPPAKQFLPLEIGGAPQHQENEEQDRENDDAGVDEDIFSHRFSRFSSSLAVGVMANPPSAVHLSSKGRLLPTLSMVSTTSSRGIRGS